MEETRFLAGKVLKWTLPVIEKLPAPEGLPVKRLLLPQGELAQCHDGDDPIHYLAYIELKAGTVRGNHFHKQKQEYVYLIQGEMRLLLEDVESKACDQTTMRTGDLLLIPPHVAHRMEIITSGHAVEFSAVRYDPADTFRHTFAA